MYINYEIAENRKIFFLWSISSWIHVVVGLALGIIIIVVVVIIIKNTQQQQQQPAAAASVQQTKKNKKNLPLADLSFVIIFIQSRMCERVCGIN